MIALEEVKRHILSGKFFKIVFLGDSMTSCEWVHPNWREIVEYVLKFKLADEMEDWKIPEWQIRGYNFGFDGAEQEDILKILKTENIPDDTYVSIFLEGAFLKLTYPTPEDYVKASKKFIDTLSKRSKKVVFCSPLPTNNSKINDLAVPYVEAFKSARFDGNAIFLDMFTKYKRFNLDNLFTFVNKEGNSELGIKPGGVDFVHPNQLGNAYIAKVILTVVFGVDYKPERYIKDVSKGKLFPGY